MSLEFPRFLDNTEYSTNAIVLPTKIIPPPCTQGVLAPFLASFQKQASKTRMTTYRRYLSAKLHFLFENVGFEKKKMRKCLEGKGKRLAIYKEKLPKFNTSGPVVLEKQKGSIWSGALFRPTNFFVTPSKYSRIASQIQCNCSPNTLELLTKYSVFADQFDCICSAKNVRKTQTADSQPFNKSLIFRVFGGEFQFVQNVAILAKAFVGNFDCMPNASPRHLLILAG